MQASIVFLLRVQCRRKESSRSLSHLLMSFLLFMLTNPRPLPPILSFGVIESGLGWWTRTRNFSQQIELSSLTGHHSRVCLTINYSLGIVRYFSMLNH